MDEIGQIAVAEQTYYNWKKKYGGMGTEGLKELRRLQKENERLWRTVSGLKGRSLSRCRACIDHVRSQVNASEHRVCRVLAQHRSTQRRVPAGRADEERLVSDMIELTRQYGRYGYPLALR